MQARLSPLVEEPAGRGCGVGHIAVPAIPLALATNPLDFLFQTFLEFTGLMGQACLLLLQLLELVTESRLVFQGMKALNKGLAFPGRGLGLLGIPCLQKGKFPLPEVKGLPKYCIHIFHHITPDHMQKEEVDLLEAFFQIMNNGQPFFNHRQKFIFQKIGQKHPVLVFLDLDHFREQT